MSLPLVSWITLVLGLAIVGYGLLQFAMRSSTEDRAREATEAMTWRSRRTRGAVLFLLGSAVAVGSLVVLLGTGL